MSTMYKFDLSKKKNCSISSFAMKETTGEDEELAAQAKIARGGSPTASVFEELVRLSIVYVDDKKVEPPFRDYDRWNSRTRAYVLQAFRSINGVDDADVDDFLKSGVPLDGSKPSGSVANDSGPST